MTYRIYIENFLIETSSDKFQRTLQVNVIGKLSSRQSNFTSSISIYKTTENYRFFELVDKAGVISNIPYITLRASLFSSSGACLTNSGLAYIEKFTEDEIKLSIYDGYISFLKAIQNKTLNDIDLSALDHVKNLSSVINSWSSSSQYSYLIGDFNGKNIVDINGTPNLNIDYQTPFARVSYLWNQIFNHFGWTYSGNIFSDNNFLQLWLSYPKPIGDVAPQTIELESQDSDLNLDYFFEDDDGVIFQSGYVPRLLPLPYSDQYIQIQPEDEVTYIDFPFITFLTSGVYEFSSNGFYVQDNEKQTYIGWRLYDSDFNSIDTGFYNADPANPTTAQINAFSGYRLALWVRKGNETDGFQSFLTGNSANPITDNLNGEQGGITTTISFIDGFLVGFNEAFIDFKITDFLKEIMMRFALTPFISKTSNNIEFKKISEILDLANAIDWSKKYVRVLETKFAYRNYAKDNLFKFRYNEENQNHHDGSLKVENQNLEEEKIEFQSKTYAAEPDKTVFEGITAVNLPADLNDITRFKTWDKTIKDDGTIEYKELDRRFYFAKNFNLTTPINVGSELLNDTQEASFPYKADYSGCDWNSLISEFYYHYQKVIRRSKLRTVELYIDSIDYENLDFSRLIYIKQLSSYFLIDKVSNYVEGRPTKFDLLEIREVDGTWNGIILGKVIKQVHDYVINEDKIIDHFPCFVGSMISLIKKGIWEKEAIILFAQVFEQNTIYAIHDNVGLEPFDFERATAATRINSDLLIDDVSINTPRVNYKKNECSHLLLEPQRTNSIINSENFSIWPTQVNVTIDSNAAIAPDGTLSADRIIFNGSFNARVERPISSVMFENNKNRPNSVYLKTESGTFNVLIGSGSSHLKNVIVTNEWQRFQVISRQGFPRIRSDIAGSVLAWGYQFETNGDLSLDIPTSYIPTTSSIVTRNQDILKKNFISEIEGEFSVIITMQQYESVLVLSDNMTKVEIPANGLGTVVLLVKRNIIELHYKDSNFNLQTIQYQNLSGLKVLSVRSNQNKTEIKNLIFKKYLLSQEQIENQLSGEFTIDGTYPLQKKYNTWIGGMGASLLTVQDFINHLNYQGRNNLTLNDIINYEVDSNGNARYFAKTEYYFHMFSGTTISASYIFDLDKNINKIQAYNPYSPLAEYFYVPNAKIAGFDLNFPAAPNHQLKLLVSFLESNIAGHLDNLDTPGADQTAFRQNGNGADLIVSDWLSTNNAGSPDGDIGVFIANGGTVTYKDLSDPLQNEFPEDVEDLSAVTINANSIEVNFSTGLTQGWIMIFIDGFLKEWVKIQDFTNIVSGLNSAQNYEMNIILADEYFNITRFSNTLEFTTL